MTRIPGALSELCSTEHLCPQQHNSQPRTNKTCLVFLVSTTWRESGREATFTIFDYVSNNDGLISKWCLLIQGIPMSVWSISLWNCKTLLDSEVVSDMLNCFFKSWSWVVSRNTWGLEKALMLVVFQTFQFGADSPWQCDFLNHFDFLSLVSHRTCNF